VHPSVHHVRADGRGAADGRQGPWRSRTFERGKIIAGVTAASKGRPVTAAAVEALADRVEDHARLHGPEVSSAELGLAVLEQLRCLDEVAYVRFASVYKNFGGAADFRRELVLLEKLQGD